jgi:hypothetical protein
VATGFELVAAVGRGVAVPEGEAFTVTTTGRFGAAGWTAEAAAEVAAVVGVAVGGAPVSGSGL